MGYTRISNSWASLKSPTRFERAMRDRDVNGNELAKLADVSPQVISNVRRGKYAVLREDFAQAIERALRCDSGTLFEYGLARDGNRAS